MNLKHKPRIPLNFSLIEMELELSLLLAATIQIASIWNCPKIYSAVETSMFQQILHYIASVRAHSTTTVHGCMTAKTSVAFLWCLRSVFCQTCLTIRKQVGTWRKGQDTAAKMSPRNYRVSAESNDIQWVWGFFSVQWIAGLTFCSQRAINFTTVSNWLTLSRQSGTREKAKPIWVEE